MKKTYAVQLVVDAVVIFLGICVFIFPRVVNFETNVVFCMLMSIYTGLEFCEFIFDRSRIEPLCIFFASGTAAFSGYFLRSFPANGVLSVTIAVWILTFAIIKIINFNEIHESKTHLFLIKLVAMSMFTLFGILVSVNMYYRVSSTAFMLAFLLTSYGVLEFGCDFLTYLSEDIKFLKE